MNGSGCKNCPVTDCCAQYRGSRCAAQRAKHNLGDPRTNADRIRAMRDEGKRQALIDFFSSWAGLGDSYIYDLGREKSAFGIGTMSFEDFTEWDESRIAELVDEFLDYLQQPAEEVTPCTE